MNVEIRIAKAKAAWSNAVDKAETLRKKLDLDCRAYRQSREKPIDAARKAAQELRAEITKLEMEQIGIVPDETVVRWQGGLWALHIKPSGYAELDPMTKDGKPHMGRYAKPPPYRLSHLIITDLKVKK